MRLNHFPRISRPTWLFEISGCGFVMPGCVSARMGSGKNRRHFVLGEAVICTQLQQGVDWPDACFRSKGWRLNATPSTTDVERICPSVQHQVRPIVSGAIEHLEEPLRMGQSIRVCGHALAREQCRQKTIPRAMALRGMAFVIVPKFAFKPDAIEAANAKS